MIMLCRTGMDDSRTLVELICINTLQVFNLSYLNVSKITKFRVSMLRLRSAHILCIETDRWTKPNSIPIYERKCLTCSVIEDEHHFVLERFLYKDLRNFYIPFYYRSRPNMQTFVELITNEN